MKMYPRHVLQDIKALLNQTDLAKITQQELRSLLCEMIETATETLEETSELLFPIQKILPMVLQHTH